VQLSEFDLRCNASDFEVAAYILYDVAFDFLLVWGHSYLVIELCSRVKDKIQDAKLRMSVLNSLGVAHRDLGMFTNAIDFYEQGLKLAQEVD
jgi:tetratricopeptide (TPR) repeat protein